MTSVLTKRHIKRSASGFLLILLLIVSACGSKDEPAGQGASPTSAASATIGQPSAGASGSASTAATKKIKDAMGEIAIPAEPSRIVVLDNAALDNLLALGVKPIGAASVAALNEPFPSYLKGTEGIANIGTIAQPNLETIAKLNPDLIIGTKVEQEAVYDKLKKIAPTVFIENVGVQWKDNLKLHAEAVGKTEEADKLLKQYEQRVEKFKKERGTKPSQVALLRPRQDHVRVYLPETFSGAIASEAGLTRPAAQNVKGKQHLSITEEQIADLDADVILWFGRENELAYFRDKIRGNPIWGTLKAVKSNQVHQVSSDTWLSGHGIQSVNLMLDDLIRIMAP
ncbi:ABC transporter substrate-binding protein [Paenibacillus sp. GYB003]|uniref:ABC transporter substrate-binding protein n=1 Tax=Paenibacillus sp. GYB003 TaxID=2994392 RepID=UPI002F967052